MVIDLKGYCSTVYSLTVCYKNQCFTVHVWRWVMVRTSRTV